MSDMFKPSPGFAGAILLTWGLQMALLYIQHKYGPRVIVPARFQVQKYNYFEEVHLKPGAENEGDIEMQELELQDKLHIEETQRKKDDCVICLQPVEEFSDFVDLD